MFTMNSARLSLVPPLWTRLERHPNLLEAKIQILDHQSMQHTITHVLEDMQSIPATLRHTLVIQILHNPSQSFNNFNFRDRQ